MSYRYRTIKRDGKTVLLHRWIMAEHLGRPLLRSEHVHHRNGDRFDNRLENLELMTCRDHLHHHKQKHPVTGCCAICSSVFTPHPTKRARQQTCSWACRNALIRLRRWGKRPEVAEAIVAANAPARAKAVAA